MYASLITFALSGLMAPQSAPSAASEPMWFNDYSAAREKGRLDGKPLAVFLATGKHGYENVAHEGVLSQSVRKRLAQQYVCVYMDGTTQAGRSMMSTFQITGQGLVISDQTGSYQAFHHSGQLSQADLDRRLAQFAESGSAPSTTVTTGNGSTSYYPAGGNQNQNWSPAPFTRGGGGC